MSINFQASLIFASTPTEKYVEHFRVPFSVYKLLVLQKNIRQAEKFARAKKPSTIVRFSVTYKEVLKMTDTWAQCYKVFTSVTYECS
jgi:hypothetical protein